MAVTIRKMRDSDTRSVLDLLATWNMAPRLGDPNAERSGIVVENSFVAETNGRIVGVASYLRHSQDLAETASLAVDPAYRGQAVGYRLQQARLEEMRCLGIRLVRTETDRPETIAWYIRKFGYRVVGTNAKKHDFSLSNVDHWTVLQLELTTANPSKSPSE